MSFIGGIVKEALTFKLKARNDGVTDQFSRIFMSKMFIISAFVMSCDFFTDRVACILDVKEGPDKFMHSSCWISGFYVYENIPRSLSEQNTYYGMPKKSRFDGITKNEGLCNTNDDKDHCKPLKRTYYDQYQYFPFYIASLAMMFYLPYIFFKAFNSDMSSLINDVKREKDVEEKEECVSEEISSGLYSSMKKNVRKGERARDISVKEHARRIADHYFDYEENGGKALLTLKTFANVVLKATYVAINFGGFLFTDHLLNKKFINYGVKWVQWSMLPNSLAYDNKEQRGFPKPGNELLPTMGFCDLTVRFSGRTASVFNDHRSVCEISTHILYQYVLLVLWFIYVAGILMSSVGFILHLLDIATVFVKCSLPKTEFNQKFGLELFVREPMYRACRKLTLREIEYLRYIRKRNDALYHGIVRIIQPEVDIPTPL